MAASVGVLAKLGIGTTSTVDSPLEFLSENIRKVRQIKDTGGIRGTRSHVAERTRADAYTVSGSIRLNPGPVELDYLLPYIMGTNKDGSNQFPLAETISDFYLSVDRVAKVFTYAGVKVGSATFSSSEGGFLDVNLNLEGKTETVGNSGTFPSLTLSLLQPYIFYDAAVTIGGTTYSVRDWEVSIDNGLRPRTLNSATRTEIPATDRMVRCRVTLPYTSSETSRYDTTTTGAAVVFTLTNGAYSLTLSLADVQFDTESPTVGGKDEIFLSLSGQARKSGTTAELIITNDSTA